MGQRQGISVLHCISYKHVNEFILVIRHLMDLWQLNQLRVGLKVTVITWTFQTCWQSTKMEKWLPKNKTNSIFVLDIYFYTYKLININHNRLSECFNRILGRTLHRGSFPTGRCVLQMDVIRLWLPAQKKITTHTVSEFMKFFILLYF